MIKKFLLSLSFLFVAAAFPVIGADQDFPKVKAEIFKPRDGLKNVLKKLQNGEEVCIGYIGGSITEWTGWREMTFKWFETTYQKAKLSQINASKGGTGSNLGAYRIGGELLFTEPHGTPAFYSSRTPAKNPDLIFVEFAVNDQSDQYNAIRKSMEGIVRKIWKFDPTIDICFVYTLPLEALPYYEKDICPRSVAADESVADHYGIPSINVAYRIVQMAREGKAIYNPEKDKDGKELPTPEGKILFARDTCHPGTEGHQVYADTVAQYIKKMEATPAKPGPHKLPAALEAANMENVKIITPTRDMFSEGWNRMDDKDGPGKWLRKYMPEIYETNKPGEKMTFKFKGSSAMLFFVAAPESGLITSSMDGGPEVKHSLASNDQSANVLFLEAPRTAGEHTLTVTLSAEKPDKTKLIESEKDKPHFKAARYEENYFRVGGILLDGELVK